MSASADAAAVADGTPRQFARHMAALVQVQRMLASSEASPEQLMDRIPDLALSVVEAKGAVFELIDGDVAVLRSGTAAVVSEAALGVRLELHGSLTGEAIRLNRTLRCDETEGDPRVAAEACRKYGLRSVLVTIIRDRSGPIGTLKLFDGTPGHFGDAEADTIELVAEALGAAIQRKQAEADAQRLLRNQMGVIQLQQKVAASSAGLETALELIAAEAQRLTGCDGAAIAILDGDELLLRATSGVAAPLRLRRFPRQGSLASLAVVSGAILRCDDAETDDRVDRAMCREIGARSVVSAPLRTNAGPAGGTINLFSSRTHGFSSAEVGTVELLAEWLAVVLQRSASADQLRHSESQYRSLFASHPLPMWVSDLQTMRFLAVNDSAVALYGYSRSEFLTMVEGDILATASGTALALEPPAPVDRPVSVSALAHRRKDGSTLDVEASASSTHFEDRAARLVFVADVTERRRVEREIQKSEGLLNIAGSVARVGGWALDLHDSSFSWTNELCSIYDLPPGTKCSALRALSYYAPESRKTIAAAFSRMRRDGTPYDLELELLTATERRLWVRSIGQPLHGSAGEIVGARGAVQDISERRASEEKFRALAANLNTTLQSITDAFCTLDREWRFTYVNAETERLLQQASDDVLGRPIWDLVPGLQTSEFGLHAFDAVLHDVTKTFEAYVEPWHQWFEFHAYPSETGLTLSFRDITSRRQSQERLLLLETCVACMKDVVLITQVDPAAGSDTRIVFVNEAFVRATGFSRAEALGSTPRMLQGPKTQRGELDRIAQSLARRETVRAELINYTKSGIEYWMEMEIVPVWSPAGEVTHFVGVGRDATGRRAGQDALRSLNETLEAKVAERTEALEFSNDALQSKQLEISSVVEHMADGVITFDDHGTIRGANGKVEAIFGHLPAALVGLHVWLLIPALSAVASVDPEEHGADASTAIAGVGRETYGRHLNGEPIVIDVAISAFRIGGQRLWTAIVRDIGERLRIMADLEQARQLAEEASNAKSAFVATMSHEIRTPMNGVIGMIDVLHQTELAPDQSRLLGVARDSAHALLAIIEDILDFSKIEAGRVELDQLPMSLRHVLEGASALVRGMAVGKGVALAVVIDPLLPAGVVGDAGRLRQIVVNLVSNAIKFSAGRKAAAVSVRAQLVDHDSERATLLLEVEDNGIGMDAATVERLFQPFAQADVSTTRRFGGTGLGLAISHHLVELMGGQFDVHSEPGVGSVFGIRMPFLLASADDLDIAGLPVEPATASYAAGAVESSAPHAASRVLVAEDNYINQKVITEQLWRLGYRAVVVANGREALALWRDGGFDALLTDLQMPEMDGYELAATIRAEEVGQRMPILALTANALKEEASRCKAAGMDDYLTKPVPMTTLDAMLQRWLGVAHRDVPPIDAQALPALIGNDPTMIGEFLHDFLTMATVAGEEMAAQQGTAQEGSNRGIAHRLKSSARAIGAVRLGALCEAIEDAPLGVDDARSRERLAAFDGELVRVRGWIVQSWPQPAPEAVV